MGLIAQGEERDLQRDLDNEIKKMPKYGYSNQNLAAARAFGRSKEAQIASDDISQDASNAAAQAQSITGSTSSLLSTIEAIQANSQSQRRNLSAQESQLGDQRLQAYFDEFDKRYNQDQNMPYQMRIKAIVDKIRHQQQLQQSGVAYEAQTSSSMLSSIGGGFGG